jgi:hypothetical protein
MVATNFRFRSIFLASSRTIALVEHSAVAVVANALTVLQDSSRLHLVKHHVLPVLVASFASRRVVSPVTAVL